MTPIRTAEEMREEAAAQLDAHADKNFQAGDPAAAMLYALAAAIRAVPVEPEGWRPSAAASDVLAERRRQVEAEGWTAEHDDKHRAGDMACAAACYAVNAFHFVDYGSDGTPLGWPWAKARWKPKNVRADLVRAAALLIAEIERLDRTTPPQEPRHD